MLFFKEKKLFETKQYQFNQNPDPLTEIIKTYAPFVKRIAQKIKSTTVHSLDLDDLIQAGIIGLIEATHSFHNHNQTTFKTYATLKVRYAIYETLRKNSGITRELSQSMKKLSHIIHKLNQEDIIPTTNLVREQLGMTFHEYACFNREMNLLRARSLDEASENEMHQENENNPYIQVLADETKRNLKTAILKLSKREQILLALYYNELLSFKEIGQILNLTEARISQIHSELLSKLKIYLT